MKLLILDLSPDLKLEDITWIHPFLQELAEIMIGKRDDAGVRNCTMLQ